MGKDYNYVFKKLIPTINRFKEKIVIIVDDDVIYPNDMIEFRFDHIYYKGILTHSYYTTNAQILQVF